MLGFDRPIHALIVGARGGVGAAMVDLITMDAPVNRVWATSTSGEGLPTEATGGCALDITDEQSLQRLVEQLRINRFAPNFVMNCSGVLHSTSFGPERSWRHLDIDTMRAVFDVNTHGVALLGKHLIPLLPRNERAVFASLSARVGSIGDNRLGGWYSYRASKAAQNMIIKGLAIEASMRWKQLVCVALHPGTVDTALSKPFTRRVSPPRLFTPATSASHLCDTIAQLAPAQSGGFFAWDGQAIEY